LSTCKAHLAHAAARRRAAFEARRSRQVEIELGRRLRVLQVISRVACSGEGRRLHHHAKVRKDLAHRLALGDDGEHTEPAMAFGTFEDVDIERRFNRAAQFTRGEAA
jgi:hypothetical protein